MRQVVYPIGRHTPTPVGYYVRVEFRNKQAPLGEVWISTKPDKDDVLHFGMVAREDLRWWTPEMYDQEVEDSQEFTKDLQRLYEESMEEGGRTLMQDPWELRELYLSGILDDFVDLLELKGWYEAGEFEGELEDWELESLRRKLGE